MGHPHNIRVKIMEERLRSFSEATIPRSDLKKVKGSDGTYAYLYDQDGIIVEAEYYEPTGEYCGDLPLVAVRVENAAGDLIARHEPRRISDDAYDIYVTDAEGTLRVILHHSDVSRGEPYTIREEWDAFSR